MVLPCSASIKRKGLSFSGGLKCANCEETITGTGCVIEKDSNIKPNPHNIYCLKCYSKKNEKPRQEWDKRFKPKPQPPQNKYIIPWA